MTDINALLDQMTLEEQVSILSGEDFWSLPAVERLGIGKLRMTDGPNGARGGGSLIGGVKSAADLVARKASPAEADAYRKMLADVAEHAANASKEGGFLGFGGVRVSDKESAFISEVKRAAGLG